MRGKPWCYPHGWGTEKIQEDIAALATLKPLSQSLQRSACMLTGSTLTNQSAPNLQQGCKLVFTKASVTQLSQGWLSSIPLYHFSPSAKERFK